ncbi:hypothetical protein CPC08DRAFT_713301 [Agrocybe pediades]|nr:hypothetical protein CPC08DRAFT_713301 [Agrocybe pediades]
MKNGKPEDEPEKSNDSEPRASPSVSLRHEASWKANQESSGPAKLIAGALLTSFLPVIKRLAPASWSSKPLLPCSSPVPTFFPFRVVSFPATLMNPELRGRTAVLSLS